MDHFKKPLCFLLVFAVVTLLLLSPFPMSVFVNHSLRSDHTIVIDPGHGGADPGKVGYLNIQEKTINLAIAKKLRKQLKKKGYKIVMTREDDTSLSSSSKWKNLYHRRQLICSTAPLLAVSIHQNSYPSPEVHGAQVFYYAGNTQSRLLAQLIQKSLIENLDSANTRQAKSNSDYYLLRENPYPTVIVECGFLSNPEEANQLTKTGYQESAAQAVTNGILAYVKTMKKAARK